VNDLVASFRASRGLLFLGLIAANAVTAGEVRVARPKYSPAERLAPARLRAVHEDEIRIQLDPYGRSFRGVTTHILATELDERALRRALREEHAYVSHDWMCDPTGYRFELLSGAGTSVVMGDEVPLSPGARIAAQFPVPCKVRLIEGGRLVTERKGDRLDVAVNGPGVYRVEAWLTLDGEDRGWIYANPIYVRTAVPAQR
jgi:hypothetical protein